MNPAKVSRDRLDALTDLPNIGKACEQDLLLLGVNTPGDLVGKCPYEMYRILCEKTGIQHDPCMIDVFISVTRFMAGEKPEPWWHYTAERKAHLDARSLKP